MYKSGFHSRTFWKETSQTSEIFPRISQVYMMAFWLLAHVINLLLNRGHLMWPLVITINNSRLSIRLWCCYGASHILAGNVNKRFSTTLTSLAVVSCKILVSFVLKLLSLSKSAITSHTCMLYELRYDNGHLYVMSCLLTTWYFIISSWFLHIKSRCCISTISGNTTRAQQ